jgi:hypothetical protein
MNSWSPERQRRLALLVVGTLVALALVWFGLISTLQAALKAKQTRIDSAQAQLNLTTRSAELADQYRQEVDAANLRLESLEGQMAHGDIYRWVVNRGADLQDQHDIYLSAPPPPRLIEVEAPPAVAYPAALYSLSGYGYFHNVGTFLADFENSSPFIRMKSFTIQATAPGLVGTREAEKLSFQMDFVTLVCTNPSAHR